MAKPIHAIRLNADLSESATGSLFVDPKTGDTFDLSGVVVVGRGVDTVRQLYNGKLQTGMLALFEEKPGIVDFAGERWHFGRIGRDSGYQYKLQNQDTGLILLFKSFHFTDEEEGPHLKIEVSPHCIAAHSTEDLQERMDYLANHVLTKPEKRQVAVHLRLDIQGWEPPADFEARLHCRSRRARSFQGIQDIDFATTSARYGRGETYMFGNASGLQMTVYNKTEEAKVRDKLDFWRDQWERACGYDADKPVWRLEFRFHHSIVQQFAEGSYSADGEVVSFNDYQGIHPHLSGLWRYACDAFKYLHRPGLFHPVWTFISGDFCVGGQDVCYKRHYKTSTGFTGKNIELALGNFISIAARERMNVEAFWAAVKKIPWLHRNLLEHYQYRGKTEFDLREHIGKLLEERYVRWGKAV